MAAALVGNRPRNLQGEEEVVYGALRLRAIDTTPYFATLILKLHPVSSPGLGTMAVDRHWRVYIDFEQVVAWGIEQSAGVLVHEANHLLRGHHDRAATFGTRLDPTRWNVAGDLEINDDLAECGIALPEGALLPHMFTDEEGTFSPGVTAEEFYRRLGGGDDDDTSGPGGDSNVGAPGDESDDNQESDADDEGGNDGEGEARTDGGDDVDDSNGPGSDGDGEPGGGSDAAAGSSARDGDSNNGEVTAGRCGSGAGGQPLDVELPDGMPSFPTVSDADAELARRKVAQDVRKHEQQKGRGTVPGSLSRWADDQLRPPQVSWRQVLRAKLQQALRTEAGAVDYTYTRPSRRDNDDGIIFPGMNKPKLTVAVVIDTSGSMSDDDLNAALSEVQGIVSRAGVKGDSLQVLSVDVQAGKSAGVRSARDVELSGGGGTDMRVGIEAAAQLKPKPNVTVVLTDGMTPWPKEKHRGEPRLVIGLIGRSERLQSLTERCPNWASVVPIDTSTAGGR